jgi:carboxypeptidase family protein
VNQESKQSPIRKERPMPSVSRLLCAVGFALLLPAVAAAQGTIAGTVKDTSGAVMPGVTVEANSPALIEKTRSVVTDATGQYRIVDLRPGTYSVTFTLPGFATVKREGIELTGSFTATINIELNVGSVSETVTVTGDSPIVDVQGTDQQRVLSKDIVDAIPAGRSHQQLAVLIPGVTGATPDVGGANTLGLVSLGIHGSRTTDMRVTANGVNLRNIGSPGQLISLQPDMGATQEVTVDYGGSSAEQEASGVQINYIPREGGNRFSGSFFGTYVGQDFQSSNYTDELKAAGLAQPNSLKRLYDFNGSGGGPIKADKLWFFSSVRWQENSSYLANNYYNKNAGDPTKWTYEPDLSQQAFTPTTQSSVNTRLTWQANAKNKFSFYGEAQPRDWGTATSTQSPEAASDFKYPKNRVLVAGWSSPVNSRLLLEGHFADHSEILYNVIPPEGTVYRPAGDIWNTLIPVLEQSSGRLYHGAGIAQGPNFLFSRQEGPNLYMVNASATYVTGAHAFKVGFNNLSGYNLNANRTVESATSYRFNNAIPNLITEYATPNARRSHLTEGAVFAQDKWSLKRLTFSAGLRFEYYNTFFPEQFLGPGPLVPNRNITFQATDWYHWKDLSPRLGLAYDVFGNGKTAFKATLSKYSLAVDPTTGNPYFNLANFVTRSWSDNDRDYIPDCDLLNPLENDECGTISDLRFGGVLPSTTTDPDTLAGWHKRPGDWEFSTSVQHELAPRVGVNVGYFRRSYYNFTVVRNRAVGPSDFSPFSITAPSDPRLPGGGNYVVGGLYDLNPDKVGQVDNFVTSADNLGGQSEHFNGVDVGINLRPRNGVILQGGLSTGATTTDNCAIVRQYLNSVTPYTSIPSNANPIGTVQSVDMCHLESGFLTQFKLLGTYPVPKIDVDVAATFQSLPGPTIAANYVASNALVEPSLGRALSGGAANTTVNIVAPGTMYGDRINSLDLRFAKLFRFQQFRTAVNFDLYNVLNSSSILSLNNSYARWLVPLSILNARLFKISVQLDF